jgi:hypothetical protein
MVSAWPLTFVKRRPSIEAGSDEGDRYAAALPRGREGAVMSMHPDAR